MIIQSVRGRLYLAVATVLIAATPVVAGITSNDRISSNGVGPVTFGMTLAQAAQAGVPLAIPKDDATAVCFLVHPKSPAGLSFMVRDGKIIRADMEAPATLKTVDGFGRGDKEPEILGFYAATSGGAQRFPARAGQRGFAARIAAVLRGRRPAAARLRNQHSRRRNEHPRRLGAQ